MPFCVHNLKIVRMNSYYLLNMFSTMINANLFTDNDLKIIFYYLM